MSPIASWSRSRCAVVVFVARSASSRRVIARAASITTRSGAISISPTRSVTRPIVCQSIRVSRVRREHWNELRGAGDRDAAKEFKDARWSLLKNPQDLTDRQADTLAALHAAGGKVPRAWAMKEMVRAIFAPGLTVSAVAELIDRLLARLSRCRLRPFIRLGRTIRKHRDGILAARRLKLSNARAEALNNKVKLIVRRAYGFHSANAALALVHLTCGPINLTLPHEGAFV